MGTLQTVLIASLVSTATFGLAVVVAWLNKPKWAEKRQGWLWFLAALLVAVISAGSALGTFIVKQGEKERPVAASVTTTIGRDYIETYTANTRPEYAILNSVTNNQTFSINDERNFVRVAKGNNPKDADFSDNLDFTSADNLTFRIFVINDATETSGRVAKDVNVRLSVETYFANEVKMQTRINWKNFPLPIETDITLASTERAVQLIPDTTSIRFINETVGSRGYEVDKSLFDLDGTAIGCTGPSGEIPSDDNCDGYIEFTAKVEAEPELPKTSSLRSDVSFIIEGETTWTRSPNVKPGDKLWVSIRVDNNGTTTPSNIALKISRTTFAPSQGNENAIEVDNFGIQRVSGGETSHFTEGENPFNSKVDIGAVESGSSATINLRLVVPPADKLPACGSDSITLDIGLTPDNHLPYINWCRFFLDNPCQ